MRLPPEIKRAMDRAQMVIDHVRIPDDEVSVVCEAAKDLLSELRRYEKKLEESTKDIKP